MKKEFKEFTMRVSYMQAADIVRTSGFTSGGFTNSEEEPLSPQFSSGGGGTINTPFDQN